MADGLRPARRFLHVCYCCRDTAPVTKMFIEGLGMHRVMGVVPEPTDGAILGIGGEVVSGTEFVYDPRGPRASPAIEVQGWVEPELVGEPPWDPTVAGTQAVGFAVPDLRASLARLAEFGCTCIGSGRTPFGLQWVTLRDPNGVTLDIVADGAIPAGETRMRHLRITCTDLDTSLSWYGGLGFEVVERVTIDDGAFLGQPRPCPADGVRLRLPDEPFEAVLIQWRNPPSHGRHPTEPNTAGLFRAALGVDDTRASHDAMVAAGWAFDRAPMAIVLKGTPVPEMWICFLSDADGVPFELVERPRSAFNPS
jgi:catechol 2,3-dioxygenase-like lactoylglutathione lyase family enzyme